MTPEFDHATEAASARLHAWFRSRLLVALGEIPAPAVLRRELPATIPQPWALPDKPQGNTRARDEYVPTIRRILEIREREPHPSMGEVAKELGCSRTTVSKKLQDWRKAQKASQPTAQIGPICHLP